MPDREMIEKVLSEGWQGSHPAQIAIVAAFRNLLTEETSLGNALHVLGAMSVEVAGLRHDLEIAASRASE